MRLHPPGQCAFALALAALAACVGQPPPTSPPPVTSPPSATSSQSETSPQSATSPQATTSGPGPSAVDERRIIAAGEPGGSLVRDAARERLAAPGLAAKAAFAPSLPAPFSDRHWQPAPADREQYQSLPPNPVRQVAEAPVSTFSVDVDTGSWSNVRRLLNAGRLPPVDAVRVEEMINYFPYDDPRPRGADPFAVYTDVAPAPWNPRRLLMRVAVTGENRALETLPPANLVFLVDVSGSMQSADKLPLLQASLKLLVARLRPQDRLSLVTYAGTTAVVLSATPGSDKAKITTAIDGLRAGGSTAGASGLDLAYLTARQGFIDGGINRILLATDGDFNVGITDFRQLQEIVAARRATGVSLSTLGFGTGNYNERLMEQLADAGDGAYSYIDTLMEGHKVLVGEMTSTLATIARDVKVQVEFNPAAVAEYRLIGYENRMLTREDFSNDRVDAGDIGAGHSVTALYELTPVGERGAVDPLRYAPATDERPRARTPGKDGAEIAFVRLRFKRPGDASSRLVEHPVANRPLPTIAAAGDDFRFAAAIAGFGQLLRGGTHTAQWQIGDARGLAATGLGRDPFGYRAEALRLMDLALALQAR